MRHYMAAIERYGVTHTGRQERKWNRGTGRARVLEEHFGPLDTTDDDGNVSPAPDSDEIKFYLDSRSKPGPNSDKKEKDRGPNRTSRKDKRNSNRREETLRQKLQKKNRWLRKQGRKTK